MTRQRLTDHRQSSHPIRFQIRAVQGKTVHGGIIARRHVQPGRQIGGQNPAVRFKQRQCFRFSNRLDDLQNPGNGFGQRQQPIFGAAIGHGEPHDQSVS